MSDDKLEEIYKSKSFESKDLENTGNISEKDKFRTARQILFGLSILYVITIIAYIIRPENGAKLLDVCNTTFPPIATLILVAYFRDHR